MSSTDLLHYSLEVQSADNRSVYTDQTIKGVILPGGSNIGGLPIGNYAQYAFTLFTRVATTIGGVPGTLYPGDRIRDTNSRYYEVLHVQPIYLANIFSHYIAELIQLQTAVEYRKLVLGTADEVTGWPELTYESVTDIDINFSQQTASNILSELGYHVKHEYMGLTSEKFLNPTSSLYEAPQDGDVLLINNFGVAGYPTPDEYEIQYIIDYMPLSEYNNTIRTNNPKLFTYTLMALAKREYTTAPATSGTWHTDSDSVRTDPRNRTKALFDSSLAAVYKDDGNTASKMVMFANNSLPLKRLFKEKGYDVILFLDKQPAIPMFTSDKKTYGFEENISVKICSFNKATVTATRLIEQTEQAVRDLLTDYISNNHRSISDTTYSREVKGIDVFEIANLNVRYERSNDDFTPTYPTVTWGPSASPTGTYTIPNVTDLKVTMLSNNKRLTVPGRVGQWTQKLGLPDLQIDMSCDLDIEPWSGGVSDTEISWKRPQTTGTKTDIKKWQVFADIQFNGELTGQTYQTLNLGYGTTMQVILDEVHVDESNGGHTLQLRFYGYNSVSATNYKTWFSINP